MLFLFLAGSVRGAHARLAAGGVWARASPRGSGGARQQQPRMGPHTGGPQQTCRRPPGGVASASRRPSPDGDGRRGRNSGRRTDGLPPRIVGGGLAAAGASSPHWPDEPPTAAAARPPRPPTHPDRRQPGWRQAAQQPPQPTRRKRPQRRWQSGKTAAPSKKGACRVVHRRCRGRAPRAARATRGPARGNAPVRHRIFSRLRASRVPSRRRCTLPTARV